MDYTWDILEQSEAADALWSIETVLVDFEGPQIALTRLGDQLRLSIVADQDDECTRWVDAPISKAEADAIRSGASTLLDALMKPGFRVSDVGHDGTLRRWWKVDPNGLDPLLLPTRGAKIPDACQVSTESVEQPVVVLDGVSVQQNTVAYKVFSEFLAGRQRVWSAIGSVLGINDESAQLSFAAAASGSVRVTEVPEDPTAYSRISERLQEIVDSYADAERFKKLAPTVRSRNAVDKYLRTIGTYRLDVLSRWGQATGFISASTAARRIAVLEETREADVEIIEVRGSFGSYNSETKHFRFTSTDKKTYIGYAPDVDMSLVAVGPEAIYDAEIEVSRIHQSNEEREDYKLASATPVTFRLIQAESDR